MKYMFLIFIWVSSLFADDRPNILWIVVEDQSKHYGFNGEKLVHTPHLDQLAAEGAVFKNAAVTAPVCSTARSALITGMYQTSIGAHHHRSSRGTEKIHLPDHIKLAPQYFKEAGYYTSLGYIGHITSPDNKKNKSKLGKSDYNFVWDESVYDAPLWTGRKKGQPFFAQIQLSGGKARPKARSDQHIPHVDVKDVTLPPYYPSHPDVLEDWAAYLDTFTLVDKEVGQILEFLKSTGDDKNTIIFFITDHGVSHARGKQFCYDEGMMIPMMIHAPGLIEPGTIRTDLVLHIDMVATSMYFAGIEVPDYMQSRPLFGPDFKSRPHLISARDRCDETVDRIRAVRTHDFKYIKNGYPQRPHLQPCAYKDNKEIYKAIREWGREGKLNDLQQNLLLAAQRDTEELYDLKNDPWELNNLATEERYQSVLKQMRQTLDQWVNDSGDMGQAPESEKMYDSDMKVYLDTMKAKKPERYDEISRNISLMKKWQREGK